MENARKNYIKVKSGAKIERSFNNFYLGDKTSAEIASIIGEMLGYGETTAAKLDELISREAEAEAKRDAAIEYIKSKVLSLDASATYNAESMQRAMHETLTQLQAKSDATTADFKAMLAQYGTRIDALSDALAAQNSAAERKINALLSSIRTSIQAKERDIIQLAAKPDLDKNARAQITKWSSDISDISLVGRFFSAYYANADFFNEVLQELAEDPRLEELNENSRLIMCQFLIRAAADSRAWDRLTATRRFVCNAITPQQAHTIIDRIDDEIARLQAGVYDTKKQRKIFVIHKRHDGESIAPLVKYIENARSVGRDMCFYSERNIRQGTGNEGEPIIDQCLSAMEHCDIVLVIVTRRMPESEDCRAELRHAKVLGKRCIVYDAYGFDRLDDAYKRFLSDCIGSDARKKACTSRESVLNSIQSVLQEITNGATEQVENDAIGADTSTYSLAETTQKQELESRSHQSRITKEEKQKKREEMREEMKEYVAVAFKVVLIAIPILLILALIAWGVTAFIGYRYTKKADAAISNPSLVRWDIALDYYQKGAKLGDSGAQYKLGKLYYEGKHVEQDYERAAALYKKAAPHRPDARLALGICYYNGQGLDQDYEKAVACFIKVIDKTDKTRSGYTEAAFYLGECYYYGYGVTKDYDQARIWYLQAYSGNHSKEVEDALKKLNE